MQKSKSCSGVKNWDTLDLLLELLIALFYGGFKAFSPQFLSSTRFPE